MPASISPHPSPASHPDVQTRGRSAPRPRSASPRPTSRTPTPAASYSAPAASSYSAPAPAGGLSKEQEEFMQRKARESRSPTPVEVRGVYLGWFGCGSGGQASVNLWRVVRVGYNFAPLQGCE